MAIRLKKTHAVAVLTVGALLCYQNCAPSLDSSDASSAYDDGLPFAYDAKLDTIAYMSCSEISADMSGVPYRRAYFTLRAGAYNSKTGGVGLTPAYRTATQYYTTETRAQTMAASTLSGNTGLTMSIRRRSNVQSFWYETPGPKTSIDTFLPPLTSTEVVGPLAASAAGLTASSPVKYINYFPSSDDKRLMEGSLNVLASEADAQKNRDNLEGGGDLTYLVMGFSGSSDGMDTTLKTPTTMSSDGTTPVATPSTRAYGLAFQPTFGVPYGTSTGTRRVMTAITEFDLTTNASRAANWQCPATYQFLIVRPEDLAVNNSLCNRMPDSAGNAAQQSALAAIRRVLRVEDWFVDVVNNCVVPKNSGDLCYGSTLGGRTIRYRQSACAFNAGDGTTCPHFVSVCVRS